MIKHKFFDSNGNQIHSRQFHLMPVTLNIFLSRLGFPEQYTTTRVVIGNISLEKRTSFTGDVDFLINLPNGKYEIVIFAVYRLFGSESLRIPISIGNELPDGFEVSDSDFFKNFESILTSGTVLLVVGFLIYLYITKRK